MAQITSYTSTDEVQSIYDAYKLADGTVDYLAIANAIEAGDDSQYAIDDLITAYVEGTGSLPPFMMAPASYIADPDAYSWMWEDETVQSLQQLGDLYKGTSVEQQIKAFFAYSDGKGVTDTQGLLSQVDQFLQENGIGNSNQTAQDIYNLFNTNDLKEVMSLFIGMGNPGMAILLYVSYGLAPQMRDVQEAALDVIDDSSSQMDDMISQLQSLDASDTSSQYEAQAVSQQLGVVAQVLQTMGQFIQQAQQISDQMIQTASNMSEAYYRSLEYINQH